jgi:hypothetical protein
LLLTGLINAEFLSLVCGSTILSRPETSTAMVMDKCAAAGVALYLGTALLFALATYLEGWNRRDGWDVGRVVGLLACSVWPLVLIVVVAAASNVGRNTAIQEPK